VVGDCDTNFPYAMIQGCGTCNACRSCIAPVQSWSGAPVLSSWGGSLDAAVQAGSA
jgi:hypothetical protein